MIQINAPRIRNLGLTLALAIVLLLILGFTMASPGRSASSASGLAAQATCTTIIDDNVVTHTTWTVAGSPYCVQAPIVVDGGITLTIDAGVTVYFSETLVGGPTLLHVDGSLVAAGTPTQPITFTSIKTTPQPGDWDAIQVISGSHAHLAYCDIGYAGMGWPQAAVGIHSPDVLIDHCTIHDTGNNVPALGLFGSGISPTIQNTVIRNNSGYAIYQETADMTPVYRNLTLTDNMTDAVYIAMSMVNGPVTLDGKELGGKPFIIADVMVDSSGVLTLSPGTEVRLEGPIYVNSDGTLSAAGTAAQPITITSAHPSAFGGGLVFERYSTAHLGYCDISRVGEMASLAAVDIRSSDVVIENSRIHDNYAHGIYIAGEWGVFTPRPTLRVNQIYNHSGVGLQVHSARPVLQGNAFYDNAEYAVENIVLFADVDARHQWWGHASGPGHPTSNPGGLGDRVSDGVVFDPWLTAPGNRLPTIQMLWPPEGTVFSELPITFTMVASDPDEWQPLYFRVEILSDTTMIATFDQTVNAFGWDRPSYSSGVTATLALSRALANGAYSWRAAVFDGFDFVPAAEERAFQVNVSGMQVSVVEPAEIIATANQTLTLQVYGMGFTHTAQVWLEQDHGGGNIERLDPVQVQIVSAEQITLGVNLTGRSGPWDVVVSQEGATKRARLYVFPYMPLMAIEYWNPELARLGGLAVHQLQLENGNTTASGGAVYVTGGAQPRFEAMTFHNNAARYRGGAIFMDSPGATLIVRRSRFTYNQVTYNNDVNTRGAAIAVQGAASRLILEDSVLANNTSERYGGAIAVEGNVMPAHLAITDSLINDNTALEVDGGAIFGSLAVITVTRSTLDNNRALVNDRMGGAVYLTGAGSALTLDGSTLSNNLGFRQGGAIYASGNDIRVNVLDGSVLTGNSTADNDTYAYGGAIYLFGNRAALNISASTVSTNTSINYGGAIYIDGNSDTDQARLTITDSEINANEATFYNGGGIWADQTLVSIANSTVDHNRAPTGGRLGGGIYLTGLNTSLALDHTSVSGNLVGRAGAGIYASGNYIQMTVQNGSAIDGNESTEDNDAAQGGGIYLYGIGVKLDIADSSIADNIAERFGGGVYLSNNSTTIPGQLTVTRSQVSRNEATDRSGGGLYTYQSAVTITQSTLSDNRAPDVSGDWAGGALYLAGAGANLTVLTSTLTGNTAAAYGGGIYLSNSAAQVIIANSVISDNRTLRNVTANTGGGGFYLSAAGASRLTVADSVFANNLSERAGGALFYYGATNSVLTVTDSRFTDNRAANLHGGGLYVRQAATTLTRVVVGGNTALAAGADGGGLYFEGSGAASTLERVEILNNRADDLGGGLYAGSTLTLRNATVSGNATNNRGGGLYRANGDITLNQSTLAENIAGNSGGALYMGGGTLTTANSTFSGNHSDADGGALWINTNANLYNTTMFNNTATGLGGGIRRATAGTVTFRNSLVAGNSPVNCSGAIGTGGTANLADDATCGSNFTNNLNAARLGPLADNGGATFTHLLLPGNPAINAGNAGVCAAAPVNGVDQRDVSRPQGAQCDIGAVEVTPRLALSKHSANQGGDPLRPGERITYTLVLVNDSPLPNSGVVITDTAPAHTAFIPGSLTVQPPSAGGTPGTPPVLLEGLTVDADSTVTVTFAVLADRPLDTGDLIVNTADARSDQVSGPLSSTVTDAVVATPQVQVVKQGPATAAVGSTVVYTFSVTNPGDTRLHNLAVQDDLTGAALYVSGDNGNGWLDLSETWVYTTAYTVQPTDPNLITNTVVVTATDAAGVAVTDSDTHTLDVVYTPRLALNKVGPAAANVGETVVYTLTVGHALAGDGSAVSSLSVTDDIAGPAAYLSGDNGDGLLQSGETWVFTAAYTLQVTDPDPLVNTATAAGLDAEGDPVSVTATHSLDINFAPVAVEDTATTDEETSVNVAVLANDGDPDGDPLVISGVETTGTLGSVTNNINDVTYDPGAAFQYLGSGESAADTFRYTITDGVFTATATVTVTVTGINDAPTISAVADQMTDEDTPVGPVAFTVGDVETPAGALTVTAASDNPALLPPSGIVLGGAGADRTVTLNPAADASGMAVVTLTVSDGELSAQTAFTLTVTAVNDAPVAVDDTATTAQATPVTIPVTLNDTDVENDPLTVAAVGASANGSVTAVTATVVYTPTPSFYGQDVFTYTVTDGNGGFATATITVTVNARPVAISGAAQTVIVGANVTLDGSGSYDPDGHLPLTYSWQQVGGPAVAFNGALSVTTFTAPATPTVLTFRLMVTDTTGLASAPDLVVITVRPPRYDLYLPLVLRNYASAPDLVVTQIVATANNIQVVIKNQGDQPVPVNEENEFWVDVYINPNPAPTAVNQSWQHLGTQGLVWGVTVDALPALTPGGVLTLTYNGPYYYPAESHIVWPLPVGTVVYAQVDSANASTTYGAVRENHELVGGPYNNILGPVLSTAAVNAAAAEPWAEVSQPVGGLHLPQRPYLYGLHFEQRRRGADERLGLLQMTAGGGKARCSSSARRATGRPSSAMASELKRVRRGIGLCAAKDCGRGANLFFERAVVADDDHAVAARPQLFPQRGVGAALFRFVVDAAIAKDADVRRVEKVGHAARFRDGVLRVIRQAMAALS